jgi:hypothetical protein
MEGRDPGARLLLCGEETDGVHVLLCLQSGEGGWADGYEEAEGQRMVSRAADGWDESKGKTG